MFEHCNVFCRLPPIRSDWQTADRQNAVMANADKQARIPTDEINADADTASASETVVTSKTVGTEPPDDEMRRRYREALDRKRGGGPGGHNAHGDQKSAAPASNDKKQRTFRRKSGG